MIMGDATHSNAGLIPANVDVVAGYVTGSPDIVWTAADWARFSVPHVTIDQGFTGSPVADAMVRDVEAGAWTPENAVNKNGWTTARPVIYCNRSTLPQVLAAGWQGGIWLAFPRWSPGTPLPLLPAGVDYVAVQDEFWMAYDLSTILDPTWVGGGGSVTPPPANWTEEMVKELPTLGVGATGPFVRRIQGLCCADGQLIAIDGIFGGITKGTVETLQRAGGITVDGIVGPQTWPVLLGL